MSESLKSKLPDRRWHIFPPQPELATELAAETGLSPILAQVLINRGFDTSDRARVFLDPDLEELPSPLEEFGDLPIALELLQEAISEDLLVAICGDYDADGMTSTALLIRALRFLGARADYAIPSRMSDGYGINRRIVDEFHASGVRLIITVDNGIAARDPIDYARELGIDVIITDHHDLPSQLPLANAILNPKMLSATSPYRSLAGVGVAYLLALSLAEAEGKATSLLQPLRELFTLGTIADLAPLTGINRRWLKWGLRQLPESEIPGVQALIQVAGLSDERSTLKPEHIGFRLGPRINAVGRIGDPQIVIELLTTEDMGVALERAMQCEQINQHRQQLCADIEQEAIAWVESSRIDLQQERVLVVVQPQWHHGTIGIVASRLVERYGVPVFIGTYEDEEGRVVRGSARGIPEFNVFEALQACDDLFEKYGGHPAAGGFSLSADRLEEMRSRLSQFANECLEIEHLKPLVKIDAQADLRDIDLDFYHQIDRLQPCGIENDPPVFWTPNARLLEQRIIGKGHIKMTVAPAGEDDPAATLKAIAWRWDEYFPLPACVDVAYKLRENRWNGNTTVELEIVGARLSAEVDGSRQDPDPELATTPTAETAPAEPPASDNTNGATPQPQTTQFYHNQRCYQCGVYPIGDRLELRIRNDRDCVLAVRQGERTGLLGAQRNNAVEVDVSQPHYYQLIKTAMQALGLNKQ